MFSLTLAATVALAQQPAPQTYYARAIYTKWKPGKAAEGQAFIKDVPYKASLNWLKGDPGAAGQITMSRVLPAGNEISHDRVRLVITSTPPELSGGFQPGSPQFVEPTGMKQADYSAKLGSLFDNVRSEIWSSAYRHGSIQQGDYVRVTWSKVPAERRAARTDLARTWESAMRAEVVKSGVVRASEAWTVRFGAEDQPYAVGITAWPDSASAYKGFGNRQAAFLKAHPGKDYHTYRQASDAVDRDTVSVQSIVYRVDLVVWK